MSKKYLVIGGGGREHAMCWKLRQDDPACEIFAAPGNAGMEALATLVPIRVTEIEALAKWAVEHQPDLTLVGPEIPLCAGVVDAFERNGLVIFGPNQKAAQLEGSKVFMKALLHQYGLPTARSEAFDRASEAHRFSQSLPCPQVIKADGLAAGKGVIIAQNPWQAARAIDDIMRARTFGGAGAKVVIEEFLDGVEASVHAVTDGTDYVLMPSAQDHKRIGEGDTGLNTGGMGAYAPAPLVTPEILETVKRTVFDAVLAALRAEGITYRGVLYAGLMLTAEGPKILEFNARFGDPETQVMLPLLESSLAELTLAAATGKLRDHQPKFRSGCTLGVVMASANYPAEPRTGDVITGLETVWPEEVAVFHSGTVRREQEITTAGGRVLTVVGRGATHAKAAKAAYAAMKKIHFEGQQYRRDIGWRILR